MGGVSSVLNPGQQVPTVVLPDDYQPPRFPSLYDPSVDVTLRQTGVFLYQAEVIWKFTVIWTLILIGGIFFLCSMMAFITSLLSLTLLRPSPSDSNPNPDPFITTQSQMDNQPHPIDSPDRARARKAGWRRRRKRPPLWPVFLIPIVGCFVGAVLAFISGTVVGFVLSAVYSAGGFSMSTWVPFLWACVQALVLIISSYSTLTSIL